MAQRVSIVIVVLNAAATIERCLSSVDRQAYPHKEIIVVDGGSTDGTGDILERRAGSIA